MRYLDTSAPDRSGGIASTKQTVIPESWKIRVGQQVHPPLDLVADSVSRTGGPSSTMIMPSSRTAAMSPLGTRLPFPAHFGRQQQVEAAHHLSEDRRSIGVLGDAKAELGDQDVVEVTLATGRAPRNRGQAEPVAEVDAVQPPASDRSLMQVAIWGRDFSWETILPRSTRSAVHRRRTGRGTSVHDIDGRFAVGVGPTQPVTWDTVATVLPDGDGTKLANPLTDPAQRSGPGVGSAARTGRRGARGACASRKRSTSFQFSQDATSDPTAMADQNGSRRLAEECVVSKVIDGSDASDVALRSG